MHLFWMGLLAWGLYQGYTSWQIVSGGGSATGTVIRLDESDTDEGVAYYPVVEFEVNGQTYTFDSDNASDPPAYRVGQEVRVRYDPADPRRARIDSLFELWGSAAILTGAGTITALIIVGFMLYRIVVKRDLTLEWDTA